MHGANMRIAIGFICHRNNRIRRFEITASKRTRQTHSQDFVRLNQNLCSDRTRTRLAAKTAKFLEFIIPLSRQAPLLELLHVAVPCKLKLNSVALVRTRTIPTERPPPVGEVSANFCG